MAHHFILPPNQIGTEEVEITGTDLEHLGRVLRLKPGMKVTVTDGGGKIYNCVIEKIDKNRAVALIQGEQVDQTEPSIEIILLQGLPKGDKMEFVIQKATELGVSQIIPVAMGRSVVQLSGAKAEKRVKRWQRIASEATKQCRRSRIPQIGAVESFASALSSLPEDTLILLPWEEELSRNLKETLRTKEASEADRLAIVIGPEGGLGKEEVVLALDRGAIPLSLGSRILRTETAALAVLTVVMYELGDFGGLQPCLTKE